MSNQALPGLPQLATALQSAVGDGLISPSASQKVLATASISPFIMQGMRGPDPRTVRSANVVVVKFIVDDSGSMAPYRATLINKANQFLEKLRRSTERDSIVISVDAIRDQPASITQGFKRISNPKLPALDPRNQDCVADFTPQVLTCNSSTALNDTIYEGVAGTLAYISAFSASAQFKKLILVVISDGQNCGQKNHSEAEIKDLMEQMQATERAFSLFFGFGPVSDFEGPALRMGFPKENIIIESAITDQVLGDKLNFVSDAIVSASQGMIIATPPPSTTTPSTSNSGFVSP